MSTIFQNTRLSYHPDNAALFAPLSITTLAGIDSLWSREFIDWLGYDKEDIHGLATGLKVVITRLLKAREIYIPNARRPLYSSDPNDEDCDGWHAADWNEPQPKRLEMPPLVTTLEEDQTKFLLEGLRRVKRVLRDIYVDEPRHHLAWWFEELKEGQAGEWKWAAENVGHAEGSRRARLPRALREGETDAAWGGYSGVAGWEGYGEGRRWREAWEDDFLECGGSGAARAPGGDGYESDVTEFDEYEVEVGVAQPVVQPAVQQSVAHPSAQMLALSMGDGEVAEDKEMSDVPNLFERQAECNDSDSSSDEEDPEDFWV